MNPTQAFANRTARLLAEGAHKDRLAYSTETKPREHLTAVEIDNDFGRFWSVMPDSEVDAFCDRYPGDISDIDHAAKCWCNP